jgi:RNA polymerase sigma-70 factor (ECF subfamily)
MSANVSTPESPNDAGLATLGAVLYARQPHQPRCPESHWVALLRAVASGDQVAFGELYGRTHRLVFTLIMRIVPNSETAEELTLDVFHDIWRRAGSYREEGGTVLGWVMNQARSRAIDRVRFEQRKKRVDPYPESDSHAATVSASDELASEGQQARRLRNALTMLTGDERKAIETTYFGGCSYAEAAIRLQQPPGTIKTRIRSGLRKLREALRGEGGER